MTIMACIVVRLVFPGFSYVDLQLLYQCRGIVDHQLLQACLH